MPFITVTIFFVKRSVKRSDLRPDPLLGKFFRSFPAFLGEGTSFEKH